MTVDDLLVALADNGTRILLDETGRALRIRGARPSPAVFDAVKAHKRELVTALHEARSLAIDQYRTGEVEAFARELHAAKAGGTLSVIDWCAGLLSVTLARRWQGVAEERAA